MLSPTGIDPKTVVLLRNYDHVPTLNEQATKRMLHSSHHPFVLALMNPVVSFLLRSPLHGLLSNSFMLVTFCGRKSGRFLSTPVNYVTGKDGTLYVLSAPNRTWWRNLVDGAPVSVRVKGQSYKGFGTAIVEPKAIADGLVELIEIAPAYRKLLSISLTPDGKLVPADVARAAKMHVLVRVRRH